MMIKLDYQKRKNHELFKSFQKSELINVTNAQNYIPIYQNFFTLTDNNFNNINLNNKWYINDLLHSIDDNKNLFMCDVKDSNNNKDNNNKSRKIPIFFKMAPLLDPFKYMVGKYNTSDPNLFTLPSLSNNDNINSKILNQNNSAYVDGFFSFLTSELHHHHRFIHGVNYYGSFLAHKNNFIVDIIDDLDYLVKSDFFNKSKNILFDVENYDHLVDDDKVQLKPLKIHGNDTRRSNFSIKSIDNEIFENIFVEDSNSQLTVNNLKELATSLEVVEVSIESPKSINGSINESTHESINELTNDSKKSINSGSTCSSRTSHTNSNDDVSSSDESESSSENSKNNEGNNCASKDENDGSNSNSNSDSDSSYDSDEDERVEATIKQFPVQVICMEYCENTMDDLIMNNELKDDEWSSIFMQIIMILLTYQKAFAFTHNDLHTNNVMYNTTDKKFLYYFYKNKHYKVPTFGKIFKIIDFGRSAYKFNSKLFFSDSFHSTGDASTQYNTEPYFNDKKPRLEPNYSFDLCRLACSIFDFIIEDMDEIKDINSCSPVVKLIVEWCTDDNGINVLYKNNGVERYPGFKLYKMIARCVHKHTPHVQLERPMFRKFIVNKTKIGKNDQVMNIDDIPAYI